MNIPEIKSALAKMNIQKPILATGFLYAYLEVTNKVFDMMDEKGEMVVKNLLPLQEQNSFI